MAQTPDQPSSAIGTDLVPAGQDIAGQLTWPEPSDQPAAIPEHLLARFLAAVEAIPADGASGIEGILEQLLRAKGIDDLNQPWAGTSGKLLAGKRLQVRGIIRRPSQYEDGPQLFLVVDSVDAKTGEPVTWTTSALAVIVQLAVARALGMFPILADIVVADKPTARGYYPYHLNVLAAGGAQAG